MTRRHRFSNYRLLLVVGASLLRYACSSTEDVYPFTSSASEIPYVTFTGADNQAKGQDIYNHDKQTEIGVSAAKAWLAP